MRQGQGAGTEFKVRGFEAMFRQYVAMIRALKRPCFYFDLTAGSGLNEEVGSPGSPLAWMTAQEKIDWPHWKACFVDIDAGRIESLRARPELHDPRVTIWQGDNRDFIRGRLLEMAAEAWHCAPAEIEALICIDPNGKNDMPWAELAWLSERLPKGVIVLNLNTAATLRWIGYWRNRSDPREQEEVRLCDGRRMLNRKHWLIREPCTFWNWTVLVGSNFRMRDYRSLGFHQLGSQQGQSLEDRLSHTREERTARVQRRLFDL